MKSATDHRTYQEYADYNRGRCKQAFPEALWNALKKDSEHSKESFDEALTELKRRIATDWIFCSERVRPKTTNYVDFKAGRGRKERFITLEVEEGRKYFKIVGQNGVWGFVMKKDDNKFKAGDILRAAHYAAPARDKARGNIFDADYAVAWTGPYI